MPEDTPPDDGGHVDPLGEATAVLLIGQDRGRQRQATAGQHAHQALVAKRTDEAVERHGRDMPNHRTQLQTQPALRRQEDIAGHLGSHRAIAEDEMRQDRKDRLARGALYAPDGEPAQSNPSIMGVSGQTPTTGAGRLVCELKAQGEEKGKDEFDKCLAIVHQLQVGGWLLEIDRDGTVLAGRFSALSHVSSSVEMAVGADETSWGNVLRDQAFYERLRASPLNPMESGLHNGSDLLKRFLAQLHTKLGKGLAIAICELHTTPDLLTENAILGDQVRIA